jgi:TRAP-type mannitol/chloroaromatic compound transport system permease large subunit
MRAARAGSLWRALLPPLLLIVACLGSILTGFATASEAAAVGAVGATVFALIARQLDPLSRRVR